MWNLLQKMNLYACSLVQEEEDEKDKQSQDYIFFLLGKEKEGSREVVAFPYPWPQKMTQRRVLHAVPISKYNFIFGSSGLSFIQFFLISYLFIYYYYYFNYLSNKICSNLNFQMHAKKRIPRPEHLRSRNHGNSLSLTQTHIKVCACKERN